MSLCQRPPGNSQVRDRGLRPAPVLTQGVEQGGAEHHDAVLAPFSAEDVNDHARGVDVLDLEASSAFLRMEDLTRPGI